MNSRDRRIATFGRDQRLTSQLSRRRLVVLLAASAGTAAVLTACGEKKLTRDNYDFPGSRKDSTGNYQMRNAQ